MLLALPPSQTMTRSFVSLFAPVACFSLLQLGRSLRTMGHTKGKLAITQRSQAPLKFTLHAWGAPSMMDKGPILARGQPCVVRGVTRMSFDSRLGQ